MRFHDSKYTHFNSCYSDDGSQDISIFIMITGGVTGANIIIIVLVVGAVFIVLHHKHKKKAQGILCIIWLLVLMCIIVLMNIHNTSTYILQWNR